MASSRSVDREALFAGVLRLADDHLVLGHRVSEWCGHAPMLEEDLALPNIALDLIGQARALYAYAGEVGGEGRDEDQLAYVRLEHEYRNLLLVERPNGDFAHTVARQLFFSVFMELFWDAAAGSTHETLAGIAAKAGKEAAYHVRHAGGWVIRLGDGTDVSAQRMAEAVRALAPYVGEMFADDELAVQLADAGVAPLPSSLEQAWHARVGEIFAEAELSMDLLEAAPIAGGRAGRHGEAMGFLLAELQYMQRAYPGLAW